MADITTGETSEGSIEGYLSCVTENDAAELDPNSTLFLRYIERWSGVRDSDASVATHSHEWRTSSLVFGRRRATEHDANVGSFVACENIAVNLFTDFIGRAIVFLHAVDESDCVPGSVTYNAEGFTVIVERQHEDIAVNTVTVLLQLRETHQSAVVRVSADRLAGFFSQVQEALGRLRGAEESDTLSTRRKRRR